MKTALGAYPQALNAETGRKWKRKQGGGGMFCRRANDLPSLAYRFLCLPPFPFPLFALLGLLLYTLHLNDFYSLLYVYLQGTVSMYRFSSFFFISGLEWENGGLRWYYLGRGSSQVPSLRCEWWCRLQAGKHVDVDTQAACLSVCLFTTNNLT